jgi:hypothetical protein
MACTGRFATAEQYNDLMCAQLDLDDEVIVSAIESALDLAASDVHAALASVGACDCTYPAWAEIYLAKLNIIDAAVIQNCPCGNKLSDTEKATFLQWLDRQFELIRAGKVEVCDGETGADYPAFGVIQRGLTEFSKAEIAFNEILKSRAA